MKRALFILVILFVGGYFVLQNGSGLISELTSKLSASLNIPQEQTQEEIGPESKLFIKPTYSFTEDNDNDGLSNAKEIIYGTDLNDPDTDNDGYSDGEEVKNDYDPLAGENAKLLDKPVENLTIKYFLWAKTKTDNNDPTLDINLILEFLSAEVANNEILPSIPDKEILTSSETNSQTVKEYFTEISAIPLPTTDYSYFEIASEAIDGNTDNLNKAVNQLGFVRSQFKSISVPGELIGLHKKYLGILEVLEDMFISLYVPQKDPVKMILNLKLGSKLIAVGQELEAQKQEILTQYSQ